MASWTWAVWAALTNYAEDAPVVGPNKMRHCDALGAQRFDELNFRGERSIGMVAAAVNANDIVNTARVCGEDEVLTKLQEREWRTGVDAVMRQRFGGEPLGCGKIDVDHMHPSGETGSTVTRARRLSVLQV